jgi:protein involved in polysaccharide export with SLBB domain
VDLRSVLDGVAKIPLQAGDRVLFRAIGDWHTGAVAEVRGAVRYPGPVPVVRNQLTVAEAIDLAGGFLGDAIRERIILGRPFIPDTTGVHEPSSANNFVQGLTRQRNHETVVDLTKGEGPVVDPGDIISVPRFEGWIEVLGQVKHPGFYDYKEGWDFFDYIDAAGGFASYADKSKTKLSRGRFGDVAYAKDVEDPAPGDLIWVPEKKPFNAWAFVRDVVAVTSQAAALVIVVREAVK